MRCSGTSGFTFLELMVVLAVSAPVLFAVVSTSEHLLKTVNSNEHNAEVSEGVRTVTERAGRLFRAAHRSTFRVRATAADVAAGNADAVGDWMVATDLDPRPSIQFQVSTGILAMNASELTTPRALEYILDPNEIANGMDDDGDGLMDEGKLWLSFDAIRTAIATGVEASSFELDGEIVRFSLLCARRDGNGQVHRTVTEHVWCVRN